jgi:hypothetical protein
MNWYKISQQNKTDPAVPPKPDLVTSPDEIDAAKEFTEHYVIFRFNNGWTIQKVEKDYDIESNLLKIDTYADEKHGEHVYSLRNEYNFPRANFVVQMSTKDPSFFGILEVNYDYVPEQNLDNEKYCNTLLKEFFDYLKTLGLKPKWINDRQDIGKIEIKDLKDYIVDEMGVPPLVYGEDDKRQSFKIGGDSDSYYEALRQAFSEAWGGQYYYSGKASELIDDIFSFANVREEIGLLDSAVQSLEEWAFDSWATSDWGESLPQIPEEPSKEDFTMEYKKSPNQQEFENEDFEKSKNVFFNEEAYNKAVKEYNDAKEERDKQEIELQEDFEPYQFGNMAYKKLQSLKEKLQPKQATKTKKKK